MDDHRRLRLTGMALLVVATVYTIVLVVVTVAEYGSRNEEAWQRAATLGPVTPTPSIDDHVAAVMRQECPACPECPTWDTLKRAGVEIVCANAFGAIPPINYWPVEAQMGCNRIKEVRITDSRIKVIGGKR